MSPATPARAPERRVAPGASPTATERRGPADRRQENNGLHVSFSLGDTAFVLGIERVREVLRAPALTPVPLASGLIAGLINLRGEIVPAIDLRPLLKAPPLRHEAMLVVVLADEGPYALVVDAVHDIIELSPTMMLAPPPNLPDYLRPLTARVCKLPDALILALDVQGVARAVEAYPPATRGTP